MKEKNSYLQRPQRGVAIVEFVVVISLLMLIMGGVIEFGRVLWYLDALSKATRDGARYMSTAAPKSTILTAAVPAARNLVAGEANAANVSPVLNATNNVSVTCQNAANVTIGCDSASVEYVRVEITNYSVAFGNWFPIASGPLTLSPHTTMRYMCTAGATVPC